MDLEDEIKLFEKTEDRRQKKRFVYFNRYTGGSRGTYDAKGGPTNSQTRQSGGRVDSRSSLHPYSLCIVAPVSLENRSKRFPPCFSG